MKFVTRDRLDRANLAVTNELDALGLYDSRVQQIDTYLVSFGAAYGWQFYGSCGTIHIPAVSLSKLGDSLRGRYTSLRDVLRHEYAHGVADTHRGLLRSRRFTAAFGAAHGWGSAWVYNPEHHVTKYASTATGEDFAEVFMYYVKHRGRLPAKFQTAPIRAKWRFVDQLRSAVLSGRRRW
jgi:hypothetical protein